MNAIVFDKFKYLWAAEGNQYSSRKLVSMEMPFESEIQTQAKLVRWKTYFKLNVAIINYWLTNCHQSFSK